MEKVMTKKLVNNLILIIIVIISIFLVSCNIEKSESNLKTIMPNMSEESISELEWLNEPESFQIEDSLFSITVTKGSDFFNNPEDKSIVASAPFLYKGIQGDFVAKTLVQPDFSSKWNALSLMLHIDSLNWIKFAFENSDATGSSIVSVVTKETSDDANGVILNKEKQVWLAMVRKNNIYSMHWSKDDKSYRMARLTSMPEAAIVKIGIEAQSPLGKKAIHKVIYFGIEERTVENLRDIN